MIRFEISAISASVKLLLAGLQRDLDRQATAPPSGFEAVEHPRRR